MSAIKPGLKTIREVRDMTDEIKVGRMERDYGASAIVLLREADKPMRLSFPASSEKPVQRWFGEEVLKHDEKCIRMDRMKGGAAPLLFNHRWDDPVGMIDGCEVKAGRLYVDAHFFDTERAKEVAAMVEGGMHNVSIGYELYVVEEDTKKQRFTATDWDVLEVSFATVPADPTVGVGRDADQTARPVRVTRAAAEPSSQPAAPAANERKTMTVENQAAAGANAENNTLLPAQARQGPSAMELEDQRVKAINNLCDAGGIDLGIRNMWITSGASLDSVSTEYLAIVKKRAESQPKATQVGLSAAETRRFSLSRAIEACAAQNWTQAGFEAEVSRTIQGKLGRTASPNRFFVPWEVQERQNLTPIEDVAYRLLKRDLTVATAGNGGYLKETANLGFIELLRNKSVLMNMGAMRLSGLVGDITIPKQSATGSATWLANEASTITEINQTFVQIAMSPKNVGGYTEISRQLLLQSNPYVEGLVMADLASVVALDIDAKGLNGSGASGQPTGILNTSGIGSVTGTSLDYADIIEFQTDVFAGNALTGSSGYVTTGAVAGLLKARVKFTSTASPIWDGQLSDANVDGYRGMASNQMPSATMLFGDFGLGVVIAEWGVLEVEVNPYANFQAGIVGVRAIASVDIGVRYPTAFSAASSIT